jgi:hypothetical protein
MQKRRALLFFFVLNLLLLFVSTIYVVYTIYMIFFQKNEKKLKLYFEVSFRLFVHQDPDAREREDGVQK